MYTTKSSRSFFSTKKGAALTEYGLTVGLIALLAIGAVVSLGDRVRDQFVTTAVQVSFVANQPITNLLVNGDFAGDTLAGNVSSHAWGISGETLDGWVSNNGLRFELHDSGHQGMYSVVGDYWLDMAESPGRMDISQEFPTLVNGGAYLFRIHYGDRTSGLPSRLEIRWNERVVTVLQAETRNRMESFDFMVVAGSGDGSNTLRLREVGAVTSQGMSLDGLEFLGAP